MNSNETSILTEFFFKMKYIKQFVSEIVSYSSTYSNLDSFSYSPLNLIQGCETFPNYGDYPETYLLRSYGKWKSDADQNEYRPQEFQLIKAEDFVIVQFEQAVIPRDIFIYEVYNPGAVVRIWAKTEHFGYKWHMLWEGLPEKCQQKVRIFSPPLRKINFLTKVIKLELNQSHLDYHAAIDAINLGGYIPESALQSLLLKTDLSNLLCKTEADDYSSVIQNTKSGVNTNCGNGINNNKNYFLALSDEIILHVFQYLDIRSLCRCAQVNKRWNHLSKDHTLYQNINLNVYWNLIQTSTFTFLTNRCKNLRKLDFSWCNKTVPHGDCCLEFAKQLVIRFKDTLTHLNFNNCYFIDPDFLHIILQCSEIVELRLHHASVVRGFTMFPAFQLKKLTILDLSMTAIKDDDLKLILQANPNLEHLNIDLCDRLHQLNHIVEIVIESNRKLKSWSSWKTQSLTSDGLTKLGQCVNLVELNLGYIWISEVSANVLTDIANGCKKLKRLILSKWIGNNRSLLCIIESCKELSYLDLLGVQSLSLDVCEKALYTLPKLRLLDISHCDKIPNEQIEIWKQEYPHVEIKRS